MFMEAKMKYETAYKINPDFDIALYNLTTLYQEMIRIRNAARG